MTRSIATGWDHRLISQNLPQWHQFIHLGGARKCSFSSCLSSSFPLLLPLLHLFIFLFCPVSPAPRPLLCVFLVLVLLLLLLFTIINLFLLHHPLLLCIPLFFSYFVCSSSSFTFPFSSSISLPSSAPYPSPPHHFLFHPPPLPCLPLHFLPSPSSTSPVPSLSPSSSLPLPHRAPPFLLLSVLVLLREVGHYLE